MGDSPPRQFHPANATPTHFSFNYNLQHIILATNSVVEYTISLSFFIPNFVPFYFLYFLH